MSKAESIGKSSATVALIGVAFPGVMCCAISGTVLLLPWKGRTPPTPVYAEQGILALVLCCLLSAIVEVVALICGIASFRTGYGKLGVVISSLWLTLFGICVVAWHSHRAPEPRFPPRPLPRRAANGMAPMVSTRSSSETSAGHVGPPPGRECIRADIAEIKRL
jgi:hypothetical protein